MIEFETIRGHDVRAFTSLVQERLDDGWSIKELDTVPLGTYMIYHIAYLTRIKP